MRKQMRLYDKSFTLIMMTHNRTEGGVGPEKTFKPPTQKLIYGVSKWCLVLCSGSLMVVLVSVSVQSSMHVSDRLYHDTCS